MKNLNKNDSELIEMTNRTISELVYDKTELQKAYNYYNGIMDAEQYKYLEDNFGIGNPTSIEFIPLIKKHIDALVNEYLGNNITPKVTCKDQSTISKITREKEISISKGVYEFLLKKLKNRLLAFAQNKDSKEFVDTSVKAEIDKLIENIDNNFISQYEIAAQDVITYIMQSRDTDWETKLRVLILDLLITGYTYFQVKPSLSGTNIKIDVLNPLNVFIDKNPESPYVRDSYKVVIRRWMSESQILNIYGNKLTNEDINIIKEKWSSISTEGSYYMRAASGFKTTGLDAGKEVIIPGYPSTRNRNLIPVYEVEWLETDSDFVIHRYSTIRIGDSIYILSKVDDNVIRSKSNPSYCGLSINGVYFTNRNSEPYSLMLACAKLQDKYNILHFYRDNLISSSGTVGDWIDVSMIPSFLGQDLTERLEKWQAYKKAGKALIDTSQEGRVSSGQASINTIFNGYDDTIKAQAIQAIQLAIESVESEASSITGVFRERLNGIEQRDAVTNVKIGANNSYIITKHYYQQMDLVAKELLTDSLNTAKNVFKSGLEGTLILGDKYQKVFTALPEYFTISDFDIHITTTTDTLKDIEYIKQLIPEFIRSQSLDPSIIFEAVTSKNLTDLKQKVQLALRKQKEENSQLQQLSQQLQQAQNQIQQYEQQLKKFESQNQELEKAKLELEQAKMKLTSQLEWFKARTDRDYKQGSIEEQKRRTDAELQQLYDGNPYNDIINKNK